MPREQPRITIERLIAEYGVVMGQPLQQDWDCWLRHYVTPTGEKRVSLQVGDGEVVWDMSHINVEVRRA